MQMKLLGEVFSKNAKQSTTTGEAFKKRHSAKAIMIDDLGNVAFIRVGKGNYYTIPGGGIDKGENVLEGLHRECVEEVGVEIEVLEPLGYVIEWRAAQDRRKQTNTGREQHSYVYLCKVVGEKGMPSFSANEIERKFSVDWLPIEEVIQLFRMALEREGEEEYNAVKTILERDLLCLEEANEIITGTQKYAKMH